MPTPTPDESAAALSPTLLKWIFGILSAAVTALYGWIWHTDRAVRALIQSQDDYRKQRERDEARDREERRQWREEISDSIRRLGERVGPLELDRAREQGRQEGLKERNA